jgi:hypothetical protein
LRSFYERYRFDHPQEKKEEEESHYNEMEEPISPVLGPVSLVNSRLITNEELEASERQALAQKIYREEF